MSERQKGHPSEADQGWTHACPCDLAEAVAACRASRRFIAAMGDLYAALDASAAGRGLQCRGCGECCRFRPRGHKLYLSTGELALLTAEPPAHAPGALERRCPYQSGPKCTAYRRRALGCRVFFCDPLSLDWSQEAYESCHGRIRQLHAVHGLPYAYVELTAALAELLLPAPR